MSKRLDFFRRFRAAWRLQDATWRAIKDAEVDVLAELWPDTYSRIVQRALERAEARRS